MKKYVLVLLILCSSAFFSCRSYNQFRMFETGRSILVDSVERLRNKSDKDYVFKVNDMFTLQVYTNSGEAVVDPNNELQSKSSVTKDPVTPVKYTVYSDGFAYLPMIGKIQLTGMSVDSADQLLSEKYALYYTSPYVRTSIVSKRVIVFGPEGGKIIPLEYQNMNLIEVIARYGGIKTDGKANNIRVLRGDMKNPDVQLINLTTIEGLRLANTDMEPGDIVYIEPKHKVWKEGMADILPFASITTSIVTLFLLFRTL
ncbi:MAG: polysaccharide biosynthesis/export family protein [Cytophagales bacterium]|nr:polysaccharide biosynthesis/export family protein [Cytophaga sp.]